MAVDTDNAHFSTAFNYQKIASEGTGSVSVPNDPINFTDVTIAHNLGYIPSVRVWYDPQIGQRFPVSEEQYVDDISLASQVNSTVARAYLTTTSLILQFRNASGSSKTVNYWYRVYYDA